VQNLLASAVTPRGMPTLRSDPTPQASSQRSSASEETANAEHISRNHDVPDSQPAASGESSRSARGTSDGDGGEVSTSDSHKAPPAPVARAIRTSYHLVAVEPKQPPSARPVIEPPTSTATQAPQKVRSPDRPIG
jgi:hypothetical protein